jgi:hypothetical protein
MHEMNEADSLSRELQAAQLARVARRSAKILKIVAAALAVGAVINAWISATTDQNEFYGGPPTEFPFKWKLQQFLAAALYNLGFAGLILAAAFAIEIIGLRATRLPEPAGAASYTPVSSAPAAEPSNFAARPAPTPAAASPSAPPPMKITNDDMWRP